MKRTEIDQRKARRLKRIVIDVGRNQVADEEPDQKKEKPEG